MKYKFKIGLAAGVLVLGFVLKIQADSVDGNGNAVPGRSDGKTVIDNSKGKEAPPMIQQGCVAPKDLEIRIGLPSWIAGVNGDAGVKGIITEQDQSFTDILKTLDMTGSGSVYFRYQRWEIFADGLYLKISDTADLRGILFNSARVSLKQAFSEQFLGYRLINCEDGFLSIFAGARWNYMQGDLHLRHGIVGHFGRRFSDDIEWVDPVIGASGRIHLWKPVSFWAKGDIGGFGAASDFTWQVQGGLEIQTTRWIYTDIGWRYLKNDYVSGGFTNKTELNGPYIETGFNF